MTETGDETPPLMTHVETTAGPVADGEVTPHIHQALAGKDWLPDLHIVDTRAPETPNSWAQVSASMG
jgi:transposase